MKTVGQLLHSQRLKRDVSIEQLSLATKIDVKYIKALEEDNYELLPSETFSKGFIRNLSLNLGCDPEEYIAVFRRDYKNPNLKKSFSSVKKSSKVNLSRFYSRFFPIVLGVTVFIVYLIFQFRAILSLPSLTITKPEPGVVLSSPIYIEGTTDTDCLVTINDDSVIKPDQNGAFSLDLNLPVGETSLRIKTTNRFSRVSTQTIPLTIISQ